MAKKDRKSFLIGLLVAIVGVGLIGGVSKLANDNNWFNDESEELSDESSINESEDSSSTPQLAYSTIDNINWNDCKDSRALDGSNGKELSTGYTNMWISGLIKVDSGKTIEFSSEPYKICYYKSDLTFIKQDKFTTADTMTKIYTIPTNAIYIKFQFCKDNAYAVPSVTYADRINLTITYKN